MFFSESLILNAPLGRVQHRLLTYLQQGDLAAAANAAYGDGATVLARAGVGGVGKTVSIESIPAYQRGPMIVVPIRWMATGPLGAAFPVLDANLEMRGVEGGTELTLEGSYRPPLGHVGEAVDRLVLGRVARSTIRSFLDRLGELASQVVRAPESTADGPETGGVEPEASW